MSTNTIKNSKKSKIMKTKLQNGKTMQTDCKVK